MALPVEHRREHVGARNGRDVPSVVGASGATMNRPLRWYHLVPLALILALAVIYGDEIDRWWDGVFRFMAGG